jgi:putative DNA primase/helicase
LNKSAFALGQLIAAGALDQAEVESALADAARTAGLEGREIEGTIRSGLEAGMAEPRDLGHVQADRGRHGDAAGSSGQVEGPAYVSPPKGLCLICADRDDAPPNKGIVVDEDDDRLLMRFLEGDPSQRDVWIHKSQLSWPDGSPLTQPFVDDPDLIKFLGEPPEPKPIRQALRPVPKLDPELIPVPFRRWLVDIAERMGCALEFPVIGAIVALASLVGRRLAIRPKSRDDWAVVANVWGGIVGRPGLMKTPALYQALQPLHRLANAAKRRFAEELARHKAGSLLRKARGDAAVNALRTAAKKKLPPEELDRLAAEAAEESDADGPVLRRYIVNDTTIEKLGEIMCENPNGLLFFRDELVGLLRTCDKPGHEADRAFLLESWAGDGPFVFDRIGRGSIHVPAVCLSILGGIQPGPLASYLRAAARGAGEDDDGFVPRFQVLAWPDTPEAYEIVDRRPDEEAEARVRRIFEAIDALEPGSIGATFGGVPIPYLRFDDDAQAFFFEWLGDLEAKLRAGDEGPAMEAHLSKYRKLMPALALLFHVVDLVDRKASGPVSLEAAERAAAWCDFLEQHARRVYEAGGQGDVEPARVLGEHIRRGDLPDPFRAREVTRKGWSRLDRAEDVEHALAVLEDHGWVYGVEEGAGPSGGRPTTAYYVNPRLKPEAP